MSGKLILSLVTSGLYTSLQDDGRTGNQHLGIPVGGAMDRKAHHLANLLVGNEPSSPVLEMTLIGPSICFEGNGQLALTGGDLSARVNDELVPMNQSIAIQNGDQLSFGRNRTGCRAYLGIKGTWLCDQWLGSVSPIPNVVLEKNILKTGDQLTVIHDDHENGIRRASSLDYHQEVVCKIQPGPEINHLCSKYDLLGTHLVSNDSNRMGIRLQSSFSVNNDASIVSSGVFPGVVQLTPSGQLIILMADAQTTGGYPRVAMISLEELNKLAQLKPSDRVIFQWE